MPSIPREPLSRPGCAFYSVVGAYLAIIMALLVWSFVGCTSDVPPPTQPTVPTPPVEEPAERAPSVVKLTVEQNALLRLHNEQRSDTALIPDAKLMEAAGKHAAWMAANNVMSHDGDGGSSFWQRIQQAGYKPSSGGENIAAGYNTPASVFQGWLNSPGHRRNILNKGWSQIGLGDAVDPRTGKRFWCVVFAQPLTGRATIAAPIVELPYCLEGPEHVE